MLSVPTPFKNDPRHWRTALLPLSPSSAGGQDRSPLHHRPVRSQSRTTAFTLIELMISVAIALVLILGVNQVFKIGAQTVGAGQALGAVSRDNRTVHTTLSADIHNALTVNQPAFIISSQCTQAFRNQTDKASDTDGAVGTLDLNGNQVNINSVLLSTRNYRTDTLGFFASGDLYQRQTANDGQYVSPTTSSDAWIWYGHVQLPNNDQVKVPPGNNPNWYDPGAADSSATNHNDNNALASSWIFGRMAMLMVPGATSSSGTENYIGPGPTTMNPLGYDAIAVKGAASSAAVGNYPIYTSRYDIVGASTSSIATLLTPPPMPPPTNADYLRLRNNMLFSDATFTRILRYQANPFPSKLSPISPYSVVGLSAADMAGIAPIFLQHCSSIIIEYAGDYLTQDKRTMIPDPNDATKQIVNIHYGDVAAGAQGDGTVDFTVDYTSDTGRTNPSLWKTKIRWYGFPRDVNNDGVIDLSNDVVPLRDILQAPAPNGAATPTATPPWEQFSATPTFPTAAPADYASSGGQVPAGAKYSCSWGSDTSYNVISNGSPTSTNGLPRMLRITLTLDDPNGRLADAQTFEYVIDLGAQH